VGTPAEYPLELYRGDTYQWTFVLWQDADRTVPYDLTGIDVKAEIRDRPSGALIIPLTLTVTPPNSILAVLDAAGSKLLPIAGAWDLQLTDPAGGLVNTVIAGPVSVTPDITDSTPPLAPRQR
jgi:hypothetical protein